MTADLQLFKEARTAIDVSRVTPGDLECWSVTTILGVLDKPALKYWSAKEAAYCAIRRRRTWEAMLEEDGEEAAVKWIRDAFTRAGKDRLSDTEFGTRIHSLVEEYTLTGVRPHPTEEIFGEDLDAARRCMEQYDAWLQRQHFEWQASEVTVFTPEYRVAGTSDGFGRLTLPQLIDQLGGERVIVDVKSSKKSFNDRGEPATLYPEIGPQLAAYRYATFAAPWHARRIEKFRRRYYLLSEAEVAAAVPVPKVDGGIGIKITPDHCTAYVIECGEDVYDAFLYILEAARFQFDMSRRIIGPPLDEKR